MPKAILGTRLWLLIPLYACLPGAGLYFLQVLVRSWPPAGAIG